MKVEIDRDVVDLDAIMKHEQKVVYFPGMQKDDIQLTENILFVNDDNELIASGKIRLMRLKEVSSITLSVSTNKLHPSADNEDEFLEMHGVDPDDEVLAVRFSPGHEVDDLEVGDEVSLEYQSSRSKNLISVDGVVEDKRDELLGIRDVDSADSVSDQRRILTSQVGDGAASIQFGPRHEIEYGFRTVVEMGYQWDRKQALGVTTRLRRR